MGQVLSIQPDLVEIITWNDAGESHYMGNFWNESLGGSDIGSYANGFDHTGWQQILSPFISAYKNGATDVSQILPNSNKPVGVMWYRTLLTTASCSSDSLGKPNNWASAQDAINYAVSLPSSGSGSNNYTINIYSNDAIIGSVAGTAGLNGGTVLGLAAGPATSQRVEVLAGSSVVISATGTKDVVAETGGICNYNYEVVGMS